MGKFKGKLDNPYERNEYIDKDFFKKNKDLYLDEPILAFEKKTKNKKKLNDINEKNNKITPKNYFQKYLKKKENNFS